MIQQSFFSHGSFLLKWTCYRGSLLPRRFEGGASCSAVVSQRVYLHRQDVLQAVVTLQQFPSSALLHFEGIPSVLASPWAAPGGMWHSALLPGPQGAHQPTGSTGVSGQSSPAGVFFSIRDYSLRCSRISPFGAERFRPLSALFLTASFWIFKISKARVILFWNRPKYCGVYVSLFVFLNLEWLFFPKSPEE